MKTRSSGNSSSGNSYFRDQIPLLAQGCRWRIWRGTVSVQWPRIEPWPPICSEITVRAMFQRLLFHFSFLLLLYLFISNPRLSLWGKLLIVDQPIIAFADLHHYCSVIFMVYYSSFTSFSYKLDCTSVLQHLNNFGPSKLLFFGKQDADVGSIRLFALEDLESRSY